MPFDNAAHKRIKELEARVALLSQATEALLTEVSLLEELTVEEEVPLLELRNALRASVSPSEGRGATLPPGSSQNASEGPSRPSNGLLQGPVPGGAKVGDKVEHCRSGLRGEVVGTHPDPEKLWVQVPAGHEAWFFSRDLIVLEASQKPSRGSTHPRVPATPVECHTEAARPPSGEVQELSLPLKHTYRESRMVDTPPYDYKVL